MGSARIFAAWGQSQGHRGMGAKGRHTVYPWHLATWGPVGAGLWERGQLSSPALH